MLKGFRDFVVRGNLVELAVAFVLGAAFATVVSSFVANVLMPLIGKAGGDPDFSGIAPGGIPVGQFITDLVAFLLIAAAVYFLVVVPYNKVMERFKKPGRGHRGRKRRRDRAATRDPRPDGAPRGELASAHIPASRSAIVSISACWDSMMLVARAIASA